MLAMTAGLILGGLSAFGAFSQSMREGARQRQQAAMLEAQARLERSQAETERQRGLAEEREISSRREEMRRAFRDLQGRNRSLLAAGYTDMYSGSAAQVSEGNIASFAADMGENAYDRAMARWQAAETVKRHNYQAAAHEANASFLQKTAANLGTSLLSAAFAGAGGFTQGYTMAGGSLKNLFSSGKSPAMLPPGLVGPLPGTRAASPGRTAIPWSVQVRKI